MYDFLNRFREYQFWEKYKGANLVLVKKNIKNEITEWNQCLNLFFDNSHCNRVKLNGDAWYTEGWSEEGCLQEGWSTECCIVEKTLFLPIFGKKCEIFVLENFPIFNIFFKRCVYIIRRSSKYSKKGFLAVFEKFEKTSIFGLFIIFLYFFF